jgi:tRNA1Val (adenine37-N6)-methyltransferase
VDYFKFKEFSIEQRGASCKVGTDGVLLGAWAEVSDAKNILDVGAGTGLITIMMAQRNAQARIDAVEIDKQAVEQACRNILASPWNERIHLVNSDFLSLDSGVGKYDLIVSNPPFFEDSLKSPDERRNKARHSDSLPQAALLKQAAKLLSNRGIISVVLPFNISEKFIREANKTGFFLRRQLNVSPYPYKPYNRALLEFSRIEVEVDSGKLYICEAASGDYSQSYRLLTRDFYLKF